MTLEFLDNGESDAMTILVFHWVRIAIAGADDAARPSGFRPVKDALILSSLARGDHDSSIIGDSGRVKHRGPRVGPF